MPCVDFIVQVDSQGGSSATVRVESPAGSGQRSFELPQDLSGNELTGGLVADAARAAGTALFQAVFAGEVGHLYYGSLSRIADDARLRILIKLNPQSPGFAALASLPWELLHDPRDRFLSLHPQRSIVRHVELQRPEDAEPLEGPLRILVAAARPAGVFELQWRRELAALRALEEDVDGLDVELLEPVTPETLHGTLRDAVTAGRPFHVLHFVGHGDSRRDTAHLIFEDARGKPKKVDGEWLVDELQGFAHLRLVFLNACRSGQLAEARSPMAGVATALVCGGVPAVVAMQHPISDGASLELSRVFYRQLVCGDPIDAALTEGRLAVRRIERSGVEWATPVLFSRMAKEQSFWGAQPSEGPPRWRGPALAAGMVLSLLLVVFLGATWRTGARSLHATQKNQEGLALLDQGHPEAAKGMFLEALESDPGNAAIHANLGDLEARTGHYAVALEHYEKASTLAPQDAVHAYNLGNLLVFLGRFEEALEPLQRAVESEPENAGAWNELGTAYRELGHLDEARAAIEEGLLRDASFSPLYRNLARVALAQGRPQDALRQLSHAGRFQEEGDLWDRQEMHFRYAQAHLGLGQVPEGCRNLEDLAALDPAGIGPWAEEAEDLRRLHDCLETEGNHA